MKRFCSPGIPDKEGNLIDVYLSDKRDKKAAEVFCRSCEKTADVHHKTTAERRRLFAPKFQEFSKAAYQAI